MEVCVDPLSFRGLGSHGPILLDRFGDVVRALSSLGGRGYLEAHAFAGQVKSVVDDARDYFKYLNDFYSNVDGFISRLRSTGSVDGFNCSDFLGYVSEVGSLSVRLVEVLPEYRVVASLIGIRHVSYEFFRFLLNDLCYFINELERARGSLGRVAAEIAAVAPSRDEASRVLGASACLGSVIGVVVSVLGLVGLHVRRLMEALSV